MNRFRSIKLNILALIAIICLVINTSCTPSNPLIIHFLDVGQADCILVKSPKGKNILIDAGNNADAPIITSFLSSQGIEKIDVIIGTHPHEDHIGAMDTVINTFDIGQVYMPKVTTTSKTFRDVLLAIQTKNLQIETAKARVSISIDPSIKAEFLAPNSEQYEDLNDYSAVLRIEYGKYAFLFTGDAEGVSEAEMVQKGYNLKADLLKAGHHGSHSSSSDEFLNKVSPAYAIIPVGARNTYGHPAQVTLDRLAQREINIYRTDLNGAIIATCDNRGITIQTER
jgi:competence protein ComEC